MSIKNPIAFKSHVTNIQIQQLEDDGIEIRRANPDFSPVFAVVKTKSEEFRVKSMNIQCLNPFL